MTTYRCIGCGASFEEPQTVCSSCGTEGSVLPPRPPEDDHLRELRRGAAGLHDNAHAFGEWTEELLKHAAKAKLDRHTKVMRAIACARTALDEARHWARDLDQLLALERVTP